MLCFGEEAAHYRVELYPTYHADRIDMPEELVPQWGDAAAFFGAFDWIVLRHETLEADDLLGGLAEVEADAGGQALLFTGDRDMFQCVSDAVTVLWPAGKGETEPIGPAEVRKRYGIRPDQVPDFIALRGDPSDGLPGAKGIGEKTARELLNEHDTLDALLALPMSLRPRVRQSLTDQADELRAFRQIATLQPAGVERPPDAPTDFAGAAAAARKRSMNRLAERLDAWAGPDRERWVRTPREEAPRCSDAFAGRTIQYAETDGGAVAVDERDAPATSVAAPADDAAARERRLAELHETQAGDPDTRVADGDTHVVQREPAVEHDRFTRDEAVPARDPDWVARTSRARFPPSSARTPSWPCAPASATASAASAGAAPSSAC